MAQTIYYVKPTASGNGSGLGGWNNATNSLPTALSTAQNGDQIWIAAGLYKPTSTTARAERFVINRNLTVYGGFAGTENSPDSRTITDFSSTTLSGDIGQVGVAADNSYRVVDMPVNNLSVVLDGLVIRDGNATPEPGLPSNLEALYSYGGGVYCRYSSLTLVSCLITANQADALGAGAQMDAVDLRLISSQFTSNTTITGGGGIYTIFGSVSATASVFADNIGGFYQPGVAGGGQGGGIALTNTSARFDRCTFRNNFAQNGGAIGVQNVPPTLTNCLFTDNRSPIGAVIYSLNGASFINCTMTRNQNQDTPGTTVAALWGSGSLTNCIVWGNNTNNQSPFPYGPFTMVNSLVQGIGPDPTNGNLDGTNASLTVFVDLANANYALQMGSPTIDAGRLSANTTPLDLAGQNRVMGCSIDMGALELVQTGRPVSVSLVSASTTVCSGQPITLTAVSQTSSASVSYTWAVGATGQIGSPTNTSIVSITPTSVGPLSVTVSVSTADGCRSSSLSTYTVVGVITQLTASSLTFCSGSVTLTAGTGGTSYSFTGPGLNQSGPGNTAIVTQGGTFSVLATSINGCTTSAETVISQNTTLPSITIALPDGSTVVVSGQTPLITLPQGNNVPVQVTGGVFYQWLTIIDRINAYEIRQVDQNTTGLFTLNKPGPYRLTVTNASGCSRTVEGVIQLRP